MKVADVKCRVCAALVVLLFAGCASFATQAAADQTLEIVRRSLEVGAQEADVELARAAIPAGLVQLEAFARSYPSQPAFRQLHADALCRYAIAYVFDEWEEASLAGAPERAAQVADRLEPLLERCVDEVRSLLPQDRRSDEAIAARLPAMTPADVPSVLWIASARSVQLALAPLAHLAELPRIQAMLERCAQLAPGFRDASAEQLLATLAAARSAVLGGDDGAGSFARARTLAPGALLVEVMYARGTAVARKDRALFESTLRNVLAADLSRWPERRASNELARRKAARYLASADRLFAR